MNKSKFVRFLIRLLAFTVLLGLIAVLLNYILPSGSLPKALPWMFLLFVTVTLAVHAVLLQISRLNPSRFVSYFMLTTFVKLILYFIAVLVYVFTVKQGLLSFVLSFFLLYIFYTVFEVITLLSQTRDEKNLRK
jgi:hypothetical protein